ncbi:MAG TPA: hypothetical protein VFH01_13450, partial [Pyrinomonadaceae bacterium]|nr:hypothetical protein [Pyrinomonadaceae bacterium]
MLGLLVLAPNERGSAHQGGSEELATRIYLHYSDTTMIYSELGLLALNPPNRTRHLTMQIRVEYKGKNRIKPELVQLFLGAYPRWSPSDKHKTHLLIFTDRRTFDVGEPEKSGYSFSLDLEMMNFTLPREQFLSVARATKVRLQLDGVDVDLTDAQLKRLKAFAKEIK